MQNDYGKLAQDVQMICRDAQAKQAAFLEHVGLTVEELKTWGDCPARHTIDRMYAAFIWPRA